LKENIQSDKRLAGKRDQEERIEQFAEEIGSMLSHEELLTLLRARLLDVYGVDMASIFLIDSLKMQLVSWLVLPGESLRKIRVPIDKTSIAGYTASSRELVHIDDPYDEEELSAIDPELKFDSSWDSKGGIRTRQVLATPIMIRRSLLGIIQFMNKRDGRVFSDKDKRHIRHLASSLGGILLNLQYAK